MKTIDTNPTEIERQIFPECAKEIIAKIAASNYGKYGNLTLEAAKLIQQVAIAENCSPVVLSISWLNESSFRLTPEPNTNGKPDDFDHWDVGPMQLNVHWTNATIRMKEVAAMAEDWSGVASYRSDGTPMDFNGDWIANIRMAARRLNAIHTKTFDALGFASPDEMRTVKYTGPNAQPYRLTSYREYAPLFQKFFECFNTDISV